MPEEEVNAAGKRGFQKGNTEGFQKGKSANPGGIKRKDPRLLSFKKISYEYFLERVQCFLGATRHDLQDLMKKPDVIMLDLIIARTLLGASLGEKESRQVLFERLWGKVQNVVEDPADANKAQVVVYLPDNGRQVKELPKGELTIAQLINAKTDEKIIEAAG